MKNDIALAQEIAMTVARTPEEMVLVEHVADQMIAKIVAEGMIQVRDKLMKDSRRFAIRRSREWRRHLATRAPQRNELMKELSRDARSCLHNWTPLHHYGPNNEHYCPTGFHQCSLCGMIAETLNGEETCAKWGEP